MVNRDYNLIKRFQINKVLMVRQSIEVNVLSGDHQVRYESRIADIVGDEKFVIETPFIEGNAVGIQVNDKLEILAQDRAGVYKLPVIVLKRKLEEKFLLVVKIVGNIKKVQERLFFRLDLFENIRFKLTNDRGDRLKTDSKKTYDAILQNISAGGLGFEVEELEGLEIKLEDVILIELSFIELSYNNILGKVVRVVEGDKEGFLSVGIEFMYENKFDRDEIMKWLFDKQRELRKKGLI